jgi:hypothetical protein
MVSLIDDIDNFFKNNKIQYKFLADGMDALKNWDFWKEQLFYSVTVITISYIISIPTGIVKDSIAL